MSGHCELSGFLYLRTFHYCMHPFWPVYSTGAFRYCMHFDFHGFNVRGFRGLAVIYKSFVHESLDINGYAWNNGQHPRI